MGVTLFYVDKGSNVFSRRREVIQPVGSKNFKFLSNFPYSGKVKGNL
jgi:hypothetical protein